MTKQFQITLEVPSTISRTVFVEAEDADDAKRQAFTLFENDELKGDDSDWYHSGPQGEVTCIIH